MTARNFRNSKRKNNSDDVSYAPCLTLTDPKDMVIKSIHHLPWKRYRFLRERDKHVPNTDQLHNKTPGARLSPKLKDPDFVRPTKNDTRYVFDRNNPYSILADDDFF